MDPLLHWETSILLKLHQKQNVSWDVAEPVPTLWQASGLSNLDGINSTEVPTGVQRDNPRPVLYVAVLSCHTRTLDADVHGTMTQSGPAWGKEQVLGFDFMLCHSESDQ